MLIRVNTIMSMLMGEVSLDVLSTSQPNATNPYQSNFWTQWSSVDFVAHIIFFVFCFTVSIVVFNILTAFAIKVLSLLSSIIHLIHHALPVCGGGAEGRRDDQVDEAGRLHQLGRAKLAIKV